MAKILEELKEKTEEVVEETPAADFFMGIVLMLLSAGVCYVVWSWPRPTGISSAPGLFPFLIASSLFIMGLIIFVTSIRNKGFQKFVGYFNIRYFQESLARGDTKLLLLALSTVLFYMIVLLNLLSFELATFIYVTGSLYVFWRPKIYKILMVSTGVTIFYVVAFRVFFKLVLPGIGM